MGRTALSMLIAFCGYSLLNIAQAVQKIGFGMMSTNRFRGWTVWVLATLATTGSSFIVLYAVSLGRVSLVGAMAGTGLASLSLFSAFVMKEGMRGRELTGTSVILGAAVLTGLFSRSAEQSAAGGASLFIFLGLVTAAGVAAAAITGKGKKFGGIVIGCFAGALGGFIPMFQKVSTSEEGKARSFVHAVARGDPAGIGSGGASTGLLAKAGVVLANPYALTWIILSILSMVVLQFALKREKAIRVIPAFSASIILIPVFGGAVCFSESLHPLQWAAIALILFGVFLLTSKPKRDAA